MFKIHKDKMQKIQLKPLSLDKKNKLPDIIILMLNSFVVENNGGKINGENYGNNIGDLWGGRWWCGSR